MKKNKYSISPNLPKGKVVQAAISSQAPITITALEACGISCLKIPPWPALAAPVQSHADMLCHPLGGKKVLVARENKHLFSSFQKNGFQPFFTQNFLQKEYPGDILLNAVQMGALCFASPFCDGTLKEALKRENVRLVCVKQGYAKCSTVVVSQEACITADPSIANSAKKEGLEVLQIRSGFVELPGYPYGFLGGACGKLANDTLAFSGDLRTHPDADAICSFLANHHVIPFSLHGGPLLDIGGILPLREEEEEEN